MVRTDHVVMALYFCQILRAYKVTSYSEKFPDWQIVEFKIKVSICNTTLTLILRIYLYRFVIFENLPYRCYKQRFCRSFITLTAERLLVANDWYDQSNIYTRFKLIWIFTGSLSSIFPPFNTFSLYLYTNDVYIIHLYLSLVAISTLRGEC